MGDERLLSEKIDVTMKVLIVDDMRTGLEVLRGRLEELGFRNIVEAKNGQEAVDALKRENDIKLIISDWQMPEMQGDRFLELVQEDDKWRLVPFIMVTGKSETEEIVHAALTGVWGYITKPYTTLQLAREIEAVFEELEELLQEESV